MYTNTKLTGAASFQPQAVATTHNASYDVMTDNNPAYGQIIRERRRADNV